MIKKILRNIPECEKWERESSYNTLERGKDGKEYLERENGDCRECIYQDGDKKDNISIVSDVT